MRKLRTVELCIVNGVEGQSVSINGYRVCGPKPWGGGKVVRTWSVAVADIRQALTYVRAPEELIVKLEKRRA